MSRTLKLMAVGAVFALGATASALAQPPGAPQNYGATPGGYDRDAGRNPERFTPVPASMTIFLRPNFQGQSATYNGANNNAPSTIVYGSIQVRGSWQFCSGVNFSGACTTVDRDIPNFGQLGLRSVASFRPLTNTGPLPPRPPVPPVPPPERGDNANLRGVNSTFFARPAERGLRVEVSDERNGPGRGNGYGRPDRNDRVDERDVQREANRFCTASGYGSARVYDSEQVNRRTYLADVLCVRR